MKPKYASGEEVKVGDTVSLGEDEGGVVVGVIEAEEYAASFPKSQWGYLGRGVLISFPLYGLVHYEKELEPNLMLLA